MKIRTINSTYELRRLIGVEQMFVLQKVKGQKISDVQEGEEFKGDRVIFAEQCTLFLKGVPVISTSKILELL